MKTFTIYRGSVAWDECRAETEEAALVIAMDRYPESGSSVWVKQR